MAKIEDKGTSVPKYTNLSWLEQKWVEDQHEKEIDAEEPKTIFDIDTEKRKPSVWLSSIDNENTQFVRYLHTKSGQEGKSALTVVAG